MIKGKTVNQSRRSVDAAARKEIRGALTTQEQLARLALRPGSSAKERQRLDKLV